MRCKDVREKIDALWEEGLSDEVCQHLAECRACEGYAREARLVRAGLRVLAEDAAPEASLGFVTRLLRQLDAPSQEEVAAAFLERVGKRFVYAAALLTLGVLLALALPASGPVRGPLPDTLMAQPEIVSARPDPLGGSDMPEFRDALPPAPRDASQKGTK